VGTMQRALIVDRCRIHDSFVICASGGRFGVSFGTLILKAILESHATRCGQPASAHQLPPASGMMM